MTMHFGATMTDKPICSILVLALALSVPLTPNPAIAQSPKSEAAAPTRLWIETDTQALGERGNAMQLAVARELGAAFDAEGVELVAEQQPDAVHVRLRFSGTAEDVRLFNYVLHFELIEGKTATQLIEPIACQECFADAMYATIAAKVPALLEAIEAERAADAAAEGPDVPSSRDGDETRVPPHKPSNAFAIAGGVVLAAGLGLTAGGAYELGRGVVYDELPPPGFGAYQSGSDHRPTGTALLGAGVGSIAVGGALLITYFVLRSKNARNAAKGSQNAGILVPVISPRTVGVGYTLQF